MLYALGGFSGGLTLYMDKGELVYEYNMMEIERYSVRCQRARSRPASAGSKSIRPSRGPAPPAEVVLSVDGKEVGRGPRSSAPCRRLSRQAKSFDVGVDLGSPVSPDYFDRRPFRFDGKIEKVEVKLK